MSWIAISAIATYNVFCWIPASLPVFAVAASAGSLFLLASKPAWIGPIAILMSLIVGVLTARVLPDGYVYYFVGITLSVITAPAAIMAAGVRRGVSAYRLLVWALSPMMLLMVLFLLDMYGASTFWRQAIDSVKTMTIDWVDAAVDSTPGKPSPEDISYFREWLSGAFDYLHRFTPGLLIMWAAMTNVAAYYFAGRMIRYKGGYCRKMVTFSLWKAGLAHMVLLACGIVMWLTGIELLKPFSENLLFIVVVTYMVVGIAVMEFYLKRHRIHRALRTAFVVMLVLSGWVGGLLAAMLGFVDSHFDFRRVRAQQIG